MDLSELHAMAADQDKGRWFDLLDPVSGAATGIRVRVAGPDSATQQRAQLALVDELAEMAGPDGQVSAEHRERARINCLAACVLDWEISEDGAPLPFTHRNVVRLLTAGRWVQSQIDGFANDRAAFRGEQ